MTIAITAHLPGKVVIIQDDQSTIVLSPAQARELAETLPRFAQIAEGPPDEIDCEDDHPVMIKAGKQSLFARTVH